MGERIFKKEVGEITSRAGEVFFLELEGHPTSGYEWRAQIDDESKANLVEVAPTKVEPGIGAGGVQRFRVEPLGTGKCQIRLSYGRAWEPVPLETRTINLEVKAEAG